MCIEFAFHTVHLLCTHLILIDLDKQAQLIATLFLCVQIFSSALETE